MDKDIRTKLEEASEKNYPMVRQEMVAMLSIEERATEFALKEIRCESVDELERLGSETDKKAFEEIRSDYIRIATEQKAIDDANLEKIVSSWKEEEKYWIKRNKKLIDKAWQWMVDWVFENAPHEVFDELMSSREEYIKEMEE